MCDSEEKRPKFGNRHLANESDVYQHNAWDNVTWDEEFRNEVASKIDANASQKVDNDVACDLEEKANHYWNEFYNKHENKFFKDRHWLFTEFPELAPSEGQDPDSNSQMDIQKCPKTILELGCGTGNTVYPILEVDKSESLFIYCCDFSEKAVQLVRENELYDEKRCHAFAFDLTSSDWSSMPMKPQSLDIVTMIFVLSAIDPIYHKKIISNIKPYLKPSGKILFRDYGFLDLTQTRFKTGRCIKDRFYFRGDNTRAYFFDETEVDQLFSEAGLTKVDLHVDRRLQLFRLLKLSSSKQVDGNARKDVTIRTIETNVKDVNKHTGVQIESEQYRQKWTHWRREHENSKKLSAALFAIMRRTRGIKSIYSTRRF